MSLSLLQVEAKVHSSIIATSSQWPTDNINAAVPGNIIRKLGGTATATDTVG
jgi:hypothetical protein